MYRFSAFWLRSKCSICSYQLNIWYEGHRPSSILNSFLQGDGVSELAPAPSRVSPVLQYRRDWHTTPLIRSNFPSSHLVFQFIPIIHNLVGRETTVIPKYCTINVLELLHHINISTTEYCFVGWHPNGTLRCPFRPFRFCFVFKGTWSHCSEILFTTIHRHQL